MSTEMGILMPYFATWHSDPCARIVVYRNTHRPWRRMRWNCKIQRPSECPFTSNIQLKMYYYYYYYYYITEFFFLIFLLNQR